MDGERLLAEMRARPERPARRHGDGARRRGHGRALPESRGLRLRGEAVRRRRARRPRGTRRGAVRPAARGGRPAAAARRCSRPCEDGCLGMVGRSRAMQEVYAQVEAAARSTVPVAITGETGSGKELVARAIHALGARSAGTVRARQRGGPARRRCSRASCSATRRAPSRARWPTGRGAWSAPRAAPCCSTRSRRISPRAQVQLLRVLDDGVVVPLGSDRGRKVDVRLVTSSNADLEAEVRRGAMREDFYHRIMVLPIRVPALRERRRGPAAARRALPAPRRRPDRGAGAGDLRHGALADMVAPRLARQRARAEERRGAHGDHRAGRRGGAVRARPAPRRKAAPRLPAGSRAPARRDGAGGARGDRRGAAGARQRAPRPAKALGISRRALYERMHRYGLQR